MRIKLLGLLCASAAAIGVAALTRDRSQPTPTAAPASPARLASWQDRADRAPAPAHELAAWRVRPPRPFADLPPAPQPPHELPPRDPRHAVDGDRPGRPVPGLAEVTR